MNNNTLKLLFLIYLLFNCDISYSQIGKVVGCIRSTMHQITEQVPFTNVRINHSKIGCSANLEGCYSIDSIPIGIQEIVVTNVCCGMMTKKIEIINNKTLEVNFEFTCQFEKNENDKTCPVCCKTDRVIPICWGDGVVPYYGGDTVLMKANRVDTSCYHPNGSFSSPCHPNWYCKRDHLEF